MVSGENFTVRAPKCRADYKQRLRQAEDGPNVITDRTFITRGFKMLLRMGLLLRLGPNVITDRTFITLGSIITLVPFTKVDMGIVGSKNNFFLYFFKLI